jgi:hypothetical protein
MAPPARLTVYVVGRGIIRTANAFEWILRAGLSESDEKSEKLILIR